MSTIAARSHSSVSLSAPLKRAQPHPRRGASWLGRMTKLALRRPGRAFVLLVFAGISAAILANALFLQKARHPAPMVSAPSQTPPARQPERQAERRVEPPAAVAPAAAMTSTAAAPLPPSRPVDLSQQARETVARPPAAVTNVPRTAAAPAPTPAPAARAAAPRDPIADLINGADMRPPADIRGVAQAKPAAPRRSAEN
ncbi:hypothetical protein [Bosea sp. (in: a-proteobacteria)]|uniref:hypothetical protein n=1 Tax=Bosea sp. (in: a-proteobacteria) TaxID=1871050 RepID=UPI002733B095|nr:hypothetical protein [Bosea sp. (in: a-proteobacteria)]MDP3408949.1 hypothetical protein [Bosea sp. (in: a-proteobacteria)]